MVSGERVMACMEYMRVEPGTDDRLIQRLMESAETYLKNAGIVRTEENGAQYDLAVWSLTLHYYDHRDSVGSEAPLPIGLRPIINQMKLVSATDALAEG